MDAHRLLNAKRINVVGTSGSGKSTFSRRLAEKLNYPYIEIDKLNWGPNWTPTHEPELRAKLEDALSDECWVLDGNYPHTIPVKWREVEVVVWLNYPFHTTVWRAFVRAVKRAYTKEELWEGTGNVESFQTTFFSKESPLWWTITSYGKVNNLMQRCMSDARFAHIAFLRLRNNTEAEMFLRGL